MLNVYSGKESIENNGQFLYDPESITTTINLNYNDLCKNIVKNIDKGDVVSDSVFNNRFGIGMYTEALSTTSKILLILTQFDYIVNASELGYNGIRYLNTMSKGNVYFNSIPQEFEPEIYPISVNGKVMKSEEEFDYYMCGR